MMDVLLALNKMKLKTLEDFEEAVKKIPELF
jgi:hypothetical protein